MTTQSGFEFQNTVNEMFGNRTETTRETFVHNQASNAGSYPTTVIPLGIYGFNNILKVPVSNKCFSLPRLRHNPLKLVFRDSRPKMVFQICTRKLYK